MAVIRWAGFEGENRAVHPKLLPESVGTVSRNQMPGRGDLRPWRNPLTVATVPGGRRTIYRMGRDVQSDSQYWLSWPSRVYAMLGFEAENPTERTYYTGDGIPKVTDNTLALADLPYPTTWRPMGLPQPTAPLLITKNPAPDGDPYEGEVQDYFYTYTYINDWGWESAPAPPSAIVSKETDALATITNFETPPPGNYQITAIRLYRTQSGVSAANEFFFLKEVQLNNLVATDDNPTLGELMVTTTWLPPPDNLNFLTPLWNGMAAGIVDNAVRFSEPFVTYAWPAAYDSIPPDGKPVGLGVFGQSLLVLTTGRPMVLAGSSPDSMDQAPLDFNQGCVAPDSIVGMGSGVAWASNDGLCFYGQGGAKVATAGLMTREDWQALRPSTIVGKLYEGLYFGSYLDAGNVRRGFMINPAQPTGIYFMDRGYDVMHFDSLQDQLYVLDGASVRRWDGSQNPMTVRARSKVFKAPAPLNFSCAEVVADEYPVTFRLFAGGIQRFEKQVTGREAFSLPGGYTALDWQVEIEGVHAVQGVAVATSKAELSQT